VVGAFEQGVVIAPVCETNSAGNLKFYYSPQRHKGTKHFLPSPLTKGRPGGDFFTFFTKLLKQISDSLVIALTVASSITEQINNEEILLPPILAEHAEYHMVFFA